MPPKGTTNGKKNSCPKDGTKVDDEGLSQRCDKNGWWSRHWAEMEPALSWDGVGMGRQWVGNG